MTAIPCVNHERNFMKAMGGGCNYPIGAYSYFEGENLNLEGIVLSLDGKQYIREHVSTKNFNNDLSKELAVKFFKKNVDQIINKSTVKSTNNINVVLTNEHVESGFKSLEDNGQHFSFSDDSNKTCLKHHKNRS